MRPVFMRLMPCALVLALGASVVQADDSAAPRRAKRYQATRNITIDHATGQARKPNADEIADLVRTLDSLTPVANEGAQGVAVRGGAQAMDLQGAFAGVMLARPGADGTMETRCVFTFEEGAEFLGLVADDSGQ